MTDDVIGNKTPGWLDSLLKNTENRDLEFKEAKSNFGAADLNEYCMGLANDSGGYLLLGVDDRGKIVGTSCYQKRVHEKPHQLQQELGIDVQAYEVNHPDGRVVVFEIPKHFPGRPVVYKGRYKIRVGSSLPDMTADQLRKIFDELEPDYSAEVCKGASVADLDQQAIDKLRSMWAKKAGRPDYLKKSDEQVLKDLRLVEGKKITIAAMILLGKPEAVVKYMPNSEVIFEWRQNPAQVKYDYRNVWRQALVLALDELWQTLDARNTVFSFQQGFVQRDVWAFNEKVAREAFVNAVVHRDYKIVSRSVRIGATPEVLAVESPGGLMHGVTVENIFDKSLWRNRLLADTLQQIGWMEKSGQGIDDIFKISIREGKSKPILKTDGYTVDLAIPARVVDEQFIRFLELATQNSGDLLSLEELLELERVRAEGKVGSVLYKELLLKKGLIESVGYGRGTQYLLAKSYYKAVGRMGEYTRIRGLDNASRRGLIQKHLEENGKITQDELGQMFPELGYYQKYNLMRGLVQDGKAKRVGGNRRDGYWEA
ncbi:putative DNA binding domain-containing protein [Candidatus Saccharibacteria bacterium]|nr:putative DNA binding domain-containing protein [Candidatus Saccharibacteria bacterium]